MAVSSQDLFVMPAGIAIADIGSFQRIVPDAPARSFAVSTPGQQVAILVEAGVGEHLDAQFSAVGTGNLAYTLYDPLNRKVVSGSASSTSPTVLLPPATGAGSYLLLVKPTQAPSSWNLAIERSRRIVPGSDASIVSTNVPGQRKRLIFGAGIDQRLGLGMEELTAAGGTSVSASVMNRDASVGSTTCYTSTDGCQLNIRATQASVHTVVFSPNSATQTFQAKVTLSDDMRLPLQREVPLDLVVPRRGQNARLFFNAQAGESLSLQVMGQTTAPAARSVSYGVYKPDGTLLSTLSATTHQLLNLPSLPQSGQYFVFVDPDYGATSASRIILSEGSTSGGQVDGEAQQFQTSAGGQSVYFNFSVTEVDQRVGVGISDLVLSSGTYVWVYVYRPDGVSAGSATCYAARGGCDVNVRAPVVGRYSVVVQPMSANQTMQLKAMVSKDLQEPITREVATQLAIPRRGQNARLYFDAQAGETLAVQIAGQATEPSGKLVNYQLFKPDGSLLTSVNSVATDTLRMPSLASAGRYMLFVDPADGATLQARITLTDGRQSAMQIDGASGEYIAPISGHPAFLTFTTTMADQRVGLALRDLQLSSGTYMNVYVYGVSGESLASTTCYANQGGCAFNIRAVAVGTYSVVVAPQTAAQLIRFNATLSNDVYIDIAREEPLDLAIVRFGQNARLKFTAAAGDNLALQVSGQSSTDSSTVTYTVQKSDGSTLTSVGATGFDNLRMLNLPVNGEYIIFVDPAYGAAMQSRVLLTAGNGGDPEIDGDVGAVQTLAGGQATFATFRVDEVDQRIGIGISDLLVSSGSYVSVNLYRPNGGHLISTTCYQSYDGCDLNVRAPEAGTYGVVLVPQSAVQKLAYNISITNDLRRVLPREAPYSLDIPRRGQNARLSFVAQAGETLGLQLVGQATVPGKRTVSYQVLKPDGSSLTSKSVTDYDTLNLANLPVSGEYLVFVDPNYGAAVVAQLKLTNGQGSGAEIDGTPGEFSTSQPGQPTYMTFQAVAGEQLGLGISDLDLSTGSYVGVQVYRPGGTASSGTNCYVSYQGCALSITAVESGTYSVVTTPQSATQKAQFKATLSRDMRFSLTRNATLDLSIPRRGQKARLSFVGQAGDALALQVAGQSTYPGSRTVYYRVYKPDGALLNNLSTTDYGAQELRLPVGGTYQVLVDSMYGETVASRVTLATGELWQVDGAPGQVETNFGGQPVRATFNASSGQKLGVGIYDLAVSTGSYASVAVYNPDGTTLVGTNCYQSNEGCKLSVLAKQSGTYSLAVTPQLSSQTLSYKVAVSQDIQGALQLDQPLDLSILRRGQNARLTFQGQAGQWLSLQIASQITAPAARTVYYRVYRPDGTQLISGSTSTYDAARMPSLPVSGEYTVLVDSGQGETLQARLTLASGGSSLALNGESATVATAIGGQEAFLTFTAIEGQRLGVALRDLQVSSGAYFSAVVSRPDGITASATCTIQAGGCEMDITANVSGVYRLFVKPQLADQKVKFTATASTDVEAKLARNALLQLSLSRPGQNGWLSFDGVSGEALTVNMEGHLTQPAGGDVYYVFYKPDGTSLTSINISASRVQSLPVLTATGTYRIKVSPNYGVPFNVGLTLK